MAMPSSTTLVATIAEMKMSAFDAYVWLRGAKTRSTLCSSWMRDLDQVERPTVSIQNGLPTWCVISWLSMRSSGEKNGFGPAGGSGSGGSTAMFSPKREAAMSVTSAKFGCCG